MNMLATIVPKSDQINADDLIGRSLTITVREVRISAGAEQPVSIAFDGSDKVFRPCKSMCRVLVAAWGADANSYVGRSLTLYRDPTVKWGGMEVGGIRISHMSDLERDMTMALTATKGARKPYTVRVLATADDAIDAARAAIAGATDLEALRIVWQSKAMAPYRQRLQSDLDARKAEISGNGRSTADHGEPVTLASAKDEIATARDEATVNALVDAHAAQMDEDDATELRLTAAERIEVLRA